MEKSAEMMSGQYAQELPGDSTCQCGLNNGLYCHTSCPGALRAIKNLTHDGYLMPPSSPNLSTSLDGTDDIVEKCEHFCREEIESERNFNEGRTTIPQLMQLMPLIDASSNDITEAHESALPTSGEDFFDASESIDDSKTQDLEDEFADFGQMLAKKNEVIESLTSQLDEHRDTVEDLDEQAQVLAAELTRAQRLAGSRSETVNALRDNIEEYHNTIKARDSQLAKVQQSVADKETTIEQLRCKLAEKSEAYAKLEDSSFAGLRSVLDQAEKTRGELIGQHDVAISKKEDLMRELAEKLVDVQATSKEKIELLEAEVRRCHEIDDEQRDAICDYANQNQKLREELAARDDTIFTQDEELLKQQRQINAHLESVQYLICKHDEQVDYLLRKITRRNTKIVSLQNEAQHLDHALACERDISERQGQQISDLQESSFVVAEQLESAIREREDNAREASSQLEFFQDIIGAKNTELVQISRAREDDKKSFVKKLEKLESIIGVKNREVEKILLKRDQDDKETFNRIVSLQGTIASRDEELKNLSLRHEAEAKKDQDKLQVLKSIVVDKTDELSKCQYNLNMITSERSSLIYEKQVLHGEITTIKADAHRSARQWYMQLNDRAKMIAAVTKDLNARQAEVADNERIIKALRADNAKLEAALEERNESYDRSMKAAHVIVADREKLVLRNNDLETDAAGWDRVASDEGFRVEEAVGEAVVLDDRVAEDDEDNADVQSVVSEDDVEEAILPAAIEVERIERVDEPPTYHEATGTSWNGVIVESESEGETGDGSTVEFEEAALGEEEDDWSDMEEELQAR